MPIDLRQTYLHLTPNRASALPVEGFWEQLMSGNPTDPGIRAVGEGGWLVSRFTHSGDWDKWECHPEGDEVIVCLSGTLVFVLEREDGSEDPVVLEAGKTLVVPTGAWHTARGAGPAEILALTAGRGTQHRPVG